MGNLSIGTQVLIAVLLGIFVGLFFGPLTTGLDPIGSAYTMLLQMTVLPYITFSLIHGLGSMTPDIGKKIFRSGWPYFATLWALMFVLIYLFSDPHPKEHLPLIQTQASSELASQFSKNFIANLIPQNPFYDIVNNIAPAVAIFGLISGLALMHIEKKEPLISSLERINQTMKDSILARPPLPHWSLRLHFDRRWNHPL